MDDLSKAIEAISKMIRDRDEALAVKSSVVDPRRPVEVDTRIADPDGWYIKPGDDGGVLYVSQQIADARYNVGWQCIYCKAPDSRVCGCRE